MLLNRRSWASAQMLLNVREACRLSKQSMLLKHLGYTAIFWHRDKLLCASNCVVFKCRLMLEQSTRRPVGMLDNERYAAYSVWCERRLLPSVFVRWSHFRIITCLQGWKKNLDFLTNNRFLGFFGFNLHMSDTKLRPTSTMKSKDKSSKQRFGHVNATNLNSYLNIIFIELVTE